MSARIAESFERLDRIIKQHFLDESALCEAKELMSEWIDSNRQLEAISNVSQLLAVLRRRGLYKSEEFTAFRLFMKLIDGVEFNRLAEQHQLLLQSRPLSEPSNVYGTQS